MTQHRPTHLQCTISKRGELICVCFMCQVTLCGFSLIAHTFMSGVDLLCENTNTANTAVTSTYKGSYILYRK